MEVNPDITLEAMRTIWRMTAPHLSPRMRAAVAAELAEEFETYVLEAEAEQDSTDR
jgi:hypothetical protein